MATMSGNQTMNVEFRPPATMPTAMSDTETALRVPVQVRIPASAEYVRVVREVVDCLCRLRSLPDDTRSAIKLAVGEAVNNAVSYAHSDSGLPSVEVMVTMGNNVLEVEVANHSGGFAPEAPSKMPDAELLTEHGRGLALMDMMMDEVEYFNRDGQTVARLRKWLP